MKTYTIFFGIIFFSTYGFAYLCSAGKYYQNITSNCNDCETGHYCPGDDKRICCPAGTYNNAYTKTSLSDCVKCTEGSICPECCDNPQSCTKGFYASENADRCLPCPEKTYSGYGATKCITCELGKYVADNNKCEACGWFGTYGNGTHCLTCPAGTYGGYLSTCTNCSKGYYKKEGDATCSQCQYSYYTDEEGQASCKQCPIGTVNLDILGSTTVKDCKPCPVGTYWTNDGAIRCIQCPKTSYNSQTGQTSCAPCPNGTLTNQTGSTDPSSCVPCPLGQSVQIPDNYYGNSEPQCLPCKSGTYRDSLTNATCTLCPGGTYGNTTGSSTKFDCIRCPYGKYSSENDRTYCRECFLGEFNNDGVCTDCPEGTYITEISRTGKCINCPSGSTSTPRSTKCVQCGINQYVHNYTKQCTPCISNSYSRPGFTKCVTCSVLNANGTFYYDMRDPQNPLCYIGGCPSNLKTDEDNKECYFVNKSTWEKAFYGIIGIYFGAAFLIYSIYAYRKYT